MNRKGLEVSNDIFEQTTSGKFYCTPTVLPTTYLVKLPCVASRSFLCAALVSYNPFFIDRGTFSDFTAAARL